MEWIQGISQDEFLRHAERILQHNTDPWKEVSFSVDEVVQWLYDLGRLYQVLHMDYEQFERYLTKPRRRRYYSWYWSRFSPENYRRPRRFIQNNHKKKDCPSYDEWWERKGFARDRRKGGKWWWRGSGKKNLKHYNNRKLRSMERKLIKSEDYDELGKNWKVEDAWSWD